MSILANKEAKPEIVKVHRRPKTERRYERVIDIVDFCRVLEKHGDRIAQLVIVPLPQVHYILTDDLNDTTRGSGGFGHTGA